MQQEAVDDCGSDKIKRSAHPQRGDCINYCYRLPLHRGWSKVKRAQRGQHFDEVQPPAHSGTRLRLDDVMQEVDSGRALVTDLTGVHRCVHGASVSQWKSTR